VTAGRRPVRRGLVLAVLAAVLTVVLPAGPAAAHASLIGTDPVDGAVLPQAPDQVVLTFNETVRLTGQPITVYDADGRQVDSTATASGAEVTVVPEGLGDGTYVVGWFVLSADGHPVSGSLTFSVGERSDVVAAPPPPPESSQAVVALAGVLHALMYLGLLLAVGLAFFVALVVPRSFAGQRARARVRRVVRVASVTSMVAAVALVPVGSVLAQGLELADLAAAFDPAIVVDDIVLAVLLVLGLGTILAVLSDRPPAPRARIALLAGGLVAVVAPAVAGHTRAYPPEGLLVAADALHLVAGATWLGGLTGLVLTLRDLAGRERLAALTLARFSALAAGLLLAVAATGTLLSWRILGGWAPFLETTYGALLLVKLGLVLAVVAVAAWNRWRLLPGVSRAAGFADRGRAAGMVHRAVSVEAVVLVGLLGVTGFLVDQSPRPAPVEVPSGRTGVQRSSLGELEVLALMSPRRPGPNTVLVQLQDETGEPVDPPRAPVVEIRSAGLDLGRVPVTSTAAGTYRAQVLLPGAGTWEVQVSVRQSIFDNPVTTEEFEVR
jgi:copper transport protein